MSEEALLNQQQLANLLGISERTLERWRSEHLGPPFIRLIGLGSVRYRRADIDHCYLLARILEKREIVIVSDQPALREIQDSLIKTTDSIDEALGYGVDRQGKHAQIALLPHATQMIPVFD